MHDRTVAPRRAVAASTCCRTCSRRRACSRASTRSSPRSTAISTAPASPSSSPWSSTGSTGGSRAGRSTESDFGKEYDSLSDMVAFGARARDRRLPVGRRPHRRVRHGRGAASAGSPRSSTPSAPRSGSRASTRAPLADKRYFEGLPSPSAAAVVAAFVWMSSELARAGPRRAHRRVRGHGARRRAHGEPLQLPELQGVRTSSGRVPFAYIVARAAGLRADRASIRRRCCFVDVRRATRCPARCCGCGAATPSPRVGRRAAPPGSAEPGQSQRDPADLA